MARSRCATASTGASSASSLGSAAPTAAAPSTSPTAAAVSCRGGSGWRCSQRLRELRDHGVRLLVELAARDAQHAVAGELERDVLAPVALELLAAAVELPRVELDHERVLRPERV